MYEFWNNSMKPKYGKKPKLMRMMNAKSQNVQKSVS